MGTAVGKNDSESGLIFEIDASNPRSYSGSGTSIYDLSGNNLTGTLTNGPTYSSLNGGVIVFDGTNDLISFSSTLLDNLTEGTISAWIKLTSTSGSAITARQRDGVNTYAVFSIGSYSASGGSATSGTAGKLYWHGKNGVTQAASTNNISANIWNHVVVTFSATQASFYINGVFDSTTSGDYSAGNSSGVLSPNYTQVGCWNNNGGTSLPLSGNIANLSVYNRALGSSEVAQIFDATKGQFITYPTTDGLVLYYDAGISASYPGSGTTWYDMQSFSNNATLVNGPTYSSNNRGYITFDGANDYADFYAPNLTTTATIEMWCNITAGYPNKMFMGWNAYDVYCGVNAIGYNTGNGDVYGIPQAQVTALGCVGNWKQYIFEMRSDVSYTNNKMYVNTASQSLSQLNSTESSGARNFNSGYGRIALWRANTGYEMPMNCAIFRVYNKSLSQEQINQNFSAFRDRFNI